jgi:hypothetical protein
VVDIVSVGQTLLQSGGGVGEMNDYTQSNILMNLLFVAILVFLEIYAFLYLL